MCLPHSAYLVMYWWTLGPFCVILKKYLRPGNFSIIYLLVDNCIHIYNVSWSYLNPLPSPSCLDATHRPDNISIYFHVLVFCYKSPNLLSGAYGYMCMGLSIGIWEICQGQHPQKKKKDSFSRSHQLPISSHLGVGLPQPCCHVDCLGLCNFCAGHPSLCLPCCV